MSPSSQRKQAGDFCTTFFILSDTVDSQVLTTALQTHKAKRSSTKPAGDTCQGIKYLSFLSDFSFPSFIHSNNYNFKKELTSCLERTESWLCFSSKQSGHFLITSIKFGIAMYFILKVQCSLLAFTM